jgi:hypothetical protein
MGGGRQREVARLCISMDDFSGSYWLFLVVAFLGPWILARRGIVRRLYPSDLDESLCFGFLIL